MPAHRRKRALKKLKSNNAKKPYFRWLFIILVFFGLAYYVSKPSDFWSGDRKTALAIQTDNGDVVVAIFDPIHSEAASIVVPAETEVVVARQKGQWRLKSVWQLGENEGLDGSLLAETLTKYLKFPVVAWADSSALAFIDPTFFGLIRAVSSPFSTNLNLKDKINLAKYSYSIDNANRVSIDLSQTNYLKKKILIDDQPGFVKNGKIPQNLAILFQNPAISEKNLKVTIRDMTESPGFAEEIGELVEALGAKVSAIDKMADESEECNVASADELYRDVFSAALYCDNVDEKPIGNSDVEITITKSYRKSY